MDGTVLPCNLRLVKRNVVLGRLPAWPQGPLVFSFVSLAPGSRPVMLAARQMVERRGRCREVEVSWAVTHQTILSDHLSPGFVREPTPLNRVSGL